jgi:hypothetical protein
LRACNNRRRDFTVRLGASSYRYPYTRLETPPAPGDHVVTARVDPELGREGFSYTFASGAAGTIDGEQVLDYNKDPQYLRDVLLHELTLAAEQRLRTNTRKSVDEVLALLGVLECEVQVSVCAKSA